MNSLQNLELYQLHRTEFVKKSLAIFETRFMIMSAIGPQSSVSVVWIHLTQCPLASSCELCIEPAGSVNGGKFLDHLSRHQLHNSNAP
jgi:hypothetical protein